MVVGQRFERWKAKPADLQSAPVDHLGNPPCESGRKLRSINYIIPIIINIYLVSEPSSFENLYITSSFRGVVVNCPMSFIFITFTFIVFNHVVVN